MLSQLNSNIKQLNPLDETTNTSHQIKQPQHPNTNTKIITSTYRVEADQKEIIIRNLKGDFDNLKNNEGQYHKLSDEYRQLQNRYKVLSDEKGNEDREFKMRHDSAVRNIGQLKTQIDALRAQLRDKKLEVTDLDCDFTQLKTQLDTKNIQLQTLRNDYKGSMADSEYLGAQRESLSNVANKLRMIILQAQEQDKLLKEDNESVVGRLQELEKYQEQLGLQERMLRQKIQELENQNNQFDLEINGICQHLNQLEFAVQKTQDQFTELQRAIVEMNMLNERHKSQIQHIQKNIQSQILKNNSYIKNLKAAEYSNNMRLGQIQQGDREVQSLKQQTQGLNRINNKLAEDLQACRVHLDNLGLLNTKLVEHLQNFTEQDQAVRELINRKPRLEYCRTMVSQTQQTNKTTLVGVSSRRKRWEATVDDHIDYYQYQLLLFSACISFIITYLLFIQQLKQHKDQYYIQNYNKYYCINSQYNANIIYLI